MNYLREKKIIINQDLFDNMLIPYLHSKAIKNQDLPLSFEVGLFNVYMGNDKAWGVEKFLLLVELDCLCDCCITRSHFSKFSRR